MFTLHTILLVPVILLSLIDGSTQAARKRTPVPIKKTYKYFKEGYAVLATTSPSNFTLRNGGRRGFVTIGYDYNIFTRFWYTYTPKWIDEGPIKTAPVNCHVLVPPHMIYKFFEDKPRPWLNISDGSDFKATWMTIKRGRLYVGSTGMGGSSNLVKIVSSTRKVLTVNWTEKYQKLREAASIKPTGYLLHEAVQWSHAHKTWFFLPKEESVDKPHQPHAPKRGSNLILKAKEDFSSVTYARYGKTARNGYPGRYLTAFTLLPGGTVHEDIIMALRAEPYGKGECAKNYVYFFDIDGWHVDYEKEMPGHFMYHGLYIV